MINWIECVALYWGTKNTLNEKMKEEINNKKYLHKSTGELVDCPPWHPNLIISHYSEFAILNTALQDAATLFRDARALDASPVRSERRYLVTAAGNDSYNDASVSQVSSTSWNPNQRTLSSYAKASLLYRNATNLCCNKRRE